MVGHRRVLALFAVLGLLVPLLAAGAGATPRAGAVGSPATTCPAGGNNSSQPVRIGVLLPLSGVDASVGADERAALQIAADIVNMATPGIALPLAATAGLPNVGGAKVELVFADTQGKADVGRAAAARLLEQDRVVALLGAYESAVTNATSAVAERAGIPYLTGDSTSPALTQRGFRWFFRTTPNDDTFSQTIFDFIQSLNTQRAAGIARVALLYENTDFGINSAAAERADAAAAGLTVAADISYAADATSLTSEVQRLQASGADVLIPSSYTSDAILTTQTAKRLGYLPKLIVAQDGGYLDPTFAKAVGADADGIATRAAFALDSVQGKPAAVAVDARFKAATGRDLYDAPARAFTGLMVLLDAINRACSTQPVAIRTALEQTNLGPNDTIMPWQGVRFDQQHQNLLGTGIILQYQHGALRTVFPAAFKTADPVYPLGPWATRAAGAAHLNVDS